MACWAGAWQGGGGSNNTFGYKVSAVLRGIGGNGGCVVAAINGFPRRVVVIGAVYHNIAKSICPMHSSVST